MSLRARGWGSCKLRRRCGSGRCGGCLLPPYLPPSSAPSLYLCDADRAGYFPFSPSACARGRNSRNAARPPAGAARFPSDVSRRTNVIPSRSTALRCAALHCTAPIRPIPSRSNTAHRTALHLTGARDTRALYVNRAAASLHRVDQSLLHHRRGLCPAPVSNRAGVLGKRDGRDEV